MKKILLGQFILSALVITLLNTSSMQCSALCPIDNQGTCNQQSIAQEAEKLRNEKRAEYETRLNLTTKQKEKLEKIKTEEQKELLPIKEEIQKTHDKLHELLIKEQEIRTTSIKKFESILNKKQKEELEKIKAEVQSELSNIPDEIK